MKKFKFTKERSLLWGSALLILWGATSCERNSSSPVKSQVESSQAFTNAKVLSAKEKLGFYKWLYREMYSQIFPGSPLQANDEVAWVNVLSQGGSIEGIYHGLILSATYRQQEQGIAKPAAIRFFARQSVLVPLVERKLNTVLEQSVERLVKEKLNSSLFTLKRELGEIFLKEIESRKSDKGLLADWYADIAVEWADLDVDFGMPQRVLRERSFHRDWANSNSIGFIQWEILNRVHRTLNQFGGVVRDKK